MKSACQVGPVYLIAAVVGLTVGLSVALVMSGFARVDRLAVICTTSVCVVGFFSGARVRRWLFGQSSHVLWQDTLVAIGLTAGCGYLLRVDLSSIADVVAVGLGVTPGRMRS